MIFCYVSANKLIHIFRWRMKQDETDIKTRLDPAGFTNQAKGDLYFN